MTVYVETDVLLDFAVEQHENVERALDLVFVEGRDLVQVDTIGFIVIAGETPRDRTHPKDDSCKNDPSIDPNGVPIHSLLIA